MSEIVVDSSVVTKWVLPESDTDRAKRLVASTGSGNQLLVLDLALVEVTNAIWNQHRRKLITTPQADFALRALFQSPMQIEPARLLLESALEIGMRYDRSIYDALFVALVSKTGFAGVTADVPLYNAVHADFPSIVLLRDWK
jgi:predicted nucleic acid-binding protein